MLPRSGLNFQGFSSINPFIEMERIRRQMDALSGMLFRDGSRHRELSPGVFPLLNLTENKNFYYIRAELPGMKAEDLDIQIVDKTLTISGERKIPGEGGRVRYHRREREAGKFTRAIGLPGEIDSGRIEARMRDGLLTVTLPKAEAAKPKQIAVT